MFRSPRSLGRDVPARSDHSCEDALGWWASWSQGGPGSPNVSGTFLKHLNRLNRRDWIYFESRFMVLNWRIKSGTNLLAKTHIFHCTMLQDNMEQNGISSAIQQRCHCYQACLKHEFAISKPVCALQFWLYIRVYVVICMLYACCIYIYNIIYIHNIGMQVGCVRNPAIQWWMEGAVAAIRVSIFPSTCSALTELEYWLCKAYFKTIQNHGVPFCKALNTVYTGLWPEVFVHSCNDGCGCWKRTRSQVQGAWKAW